MTTILLAALLVAALVTIAVLWQRLRALKAKYQEQSKIAGAFRASPDAVTLSALPQGTLVEANEAFTKITGWSREDTLGRSALELELWPDPEDRQQIYAMVMEQGAVRDYEMRFRRRDGEIRWGLLFAEILEIDGQQFYFAIVRDYTTQRLAAETLRASEEKFATVFHSSPDAIVVTTLPDGVILEINDGWNRISGWSRDEALGRSTLDLDVWDDLTQREHFFRDLNATGSVRSMEFIVRRRDGSRRTCLISAEPVTLEGQPRLVSVIRDVTELRLAEAEREAMITQLGAKNAELERFTYTVSHDLKSPLVTIRGFLGMLERHVVTGDLKTFREDAARIQTATDHMCQLLDELLELARVGHRMGTLREVALSDLARTAVDHLANELDKAGVTVDIEAQLPTVTGDRLRLLEVFQNLISNAAKFLGDQPAPRIEVGCHPPAGAKDAEEAVIFVRDNGIGIEPRYHEQVFGLFNRLDSEIPGTGVGLALVKRIVEVHGGRIWVESDGAGRGSSICFTLS